MSHIANTQLPLATPCPLCHDVDVTTACRFCGFSKADGQRIVHAHKILLEAGWDALDPDQQALLHRWDGGFE